MQTYVDDFLDQDENTIKKSIGYRQILSKYLTTSPFDKLHEILNCAIYISYFYILEIDFDKQILFDSFSN